MVSFSAVIKSESRSRSSVPIEQMLQKSLPKLQKKSSRIFNESFSQNFMLQINNTNESPKRTSHKSKNCSYCILRHLAIRLPNFVTEDNIL